jgi:hypothetical protein
MRQGEKSRFIGFRLVRAYLSLEITFHAIILLKGEFHHLVLDPVDTQLHREYPRHYESNPSF